MGVGGGTGISGLPEGWVQWVPCGCVLRCFYLGHIGKMLGAEVSSGQGYYCMLCWGHLGEIAGAVVEPSVAALAGH